MHWELSEEQSLYAVSLREWLDARAGAATVRAWLESGDVGTFDDALTEDGWSAVGFDESVGGQGGALLELALAAREFGRVAVPSAAWLARAVVDPVLAADAGLRRRSIEGGELTVLAVRGDRIPAAARSVSLRDGLLRGRVPNVIAAQSAQRFLVPVASDGAHAFVVADRDSDEVHVRPRNLLDLSRDAGDVVFDGAPVRVIECANPTATLASIADTAAVLVAADALGSAERMLEMTVEYAKQRKQFRRPIAAFQAVKHAAAQMLVTVEASQSVALYAAASVQEATPEARLHAAAAKAQVTAGCVALADSALTVHGAIGYTWEYDLQLLYKRANLDRVLFGTPSAWNERLASALPILATAAS